MKVAVIGGKGAIGRRYVSIINYLGHEAIVIDKPGAHPTRILEFQPRDFDKAIIAVPTEGHLTWAWHLIIRGYDVLIEKPLSHNEKDCRSLIKLKSSLYGHASVVCNYKYVMDNYPGQRLHTYDFFHSGKEGIYWDCCQLIYLSPEIELNTRSPWWCLITENREMIDYRLVEISYIKMVDDFITGKYENLWTLEDGLKMTEAVRERRRSDSIVRDSSPGKQHATTQ